MIPKQFQKSASWLTLPHCRGDVLTHPMLTTVGFFSFFDSRFTGSIVASPFSKVPPCSSRVLTHPPSPSFLDTCGKSWSKRWRKTESIFVFLPSQRKVMSMLNKPPSYYGKIIKLIFIFSRKGIKKITQLSTNINITHQISYGCQCTNNFCSYQWTNEQYIIQK